MTEGEDSCLRYWESSGRGKLEPKCGSAGFRMFSYRLIGAKPQTVEELGVKFCLRPKKSFECRASGFCSLWSCRPKGSDFARHTM